MAKRIAVVLATVLAALLGGVLSTGTAAAAGKNGVLEYSEFGMYYYTNYNGPLFDLFLSDSNFADDAFPGTGIPANNNTESDYNNDYFTWWVCTGASYSGSCGYVSPYSGGNFNSTYKNTVSSAYYA